MAMDQEAAATKDKATVGQVETAAARKAGEAPQASCLLVP